MQVSKHYQGERGRKYCEGRQDILNHLGYTLQSRYFIPFLEQHDEILDFGCGNGSILAQVRPRVKSVSGLEVNEHSRALAISQDIETFAGLPEIPSDRIFNKIISNHALEHVPDVYKTLCTLRKHLARDGLLIVMLPIDDFREKRNQKWNPDDKDRHLYTWTPLLFGNLLSEAGFDPVRMEIITSAWSPRLFFLGDGHLQGLAGNILSRILKRRQLLAVAKHGG